MAETTCNFCGAPLSLENWHICSERPSPLDPSEWAEYRVVLDALIRARVPNGTTGALDMLDALVLRAAGTPGGGA